MDSFTMPKNKSSEIECKFKEFKGIRFLDIREMVRDENGNPIPTKKGVTIAEDKVPEFIKELNELCRCYFSKKEN